MNDPVRVLIVGHCSPAIHGQSIQYAQLIAGSREWGDVNVEVLNTVYASSRDNLSGFSIGKLLKVLNYASNMCIRARKQNTDIIVLSPAFHLGPFLKDSVFIFLAKYVCQAKIVAWIHMDPNRLEWKRRSWLLQRYATYIASLLDILVSCAPSLGAEWPDFLKQSPVLSVANGVSDTCQARVPEGRDPDCIRIGYLSALDKKKGWRDLYNVAIQICASEAKVEFHFYGDIGAGESQEEVERIFANSDYQDRIQWHGPAWEEKKRKAFEEMDLYCFPSHTEAFPLSILEAMSFSLPIVSTDVGAVKDALVVGKGGWLCKAEDESSLMKALSEALQSRAEWQSIGASNRAVYLAEFSANAFVDKWYKVFKDPGFQGDCSSELNE